MSHVIDAILSFKLGPLSKLVDDGFDINSPIEGMTPLEWACSVGNGAAAILLINAGADRDTRTKDGETPLMLAAYSGLLDAIHVMLASQVKLDSVDQLGRDALMFAAKGGRTDCVTSLCQTGANPTRKDVYGRTALQWALMEADNSDVVKALIAQGALSDDRTIGDGAMQYAEQLGRHLSAEIIGYAMKPKSAPGKSL